MLFSVLRDTALSGSEKLMYLLILVFCVLLSLTVHELCHGLAAYAMGDIFALAPPCLGPFNDPTAAAIAE